MQRYWLDRYGYEYEGAPGLVQADVWGAEAALGYGGASTDGRSNVSLGARFTDTDLDPDDPKASARGSQLGAKVQAEIEHAHRAGWVARRGAIASYCEPAERLLGTRAPDALQHLRRVRSAWESWRAATTKPMPRRPDSSLRPVAGRRAPGWSATVRAGTGSRRTSVTAPTGASSSGTRSDPSCGHGSPVASPIRMLDVSPSNDAAAARDVTNATA